MRKGTTMEPCPRCGDTGGGCPEYFGMLGNGFCPVFRDGMTAVETAQLYYDLLMRADRENSALRGEVRRLKMRGFVARLLNAESGGR
jgi:hypothetical protein